MKSELRPSWELPATWLRFLIIILLLLGVFFRFVNIDKKIYWRDEALTSLQISGYTQTELIQQVANGRVIGLEDLQKYQHPTREKSLTDTIKSLAVETPEHPPLYYVMMRIWVQLFGSTPGAIRSLSAVISLLVFPCLYWICLELFQSSLTGWIALALVAVSPFHVLYAQEAREYSLWTVTILLSSAALLRAMRINTKLSWGIYALSLSLSLYSYLFSIFVAIGHGIYVIAAENLRFSKTVIAYLTAAIAALLIFLPWIVTVITNLSQLSSSMAWINYKLTLAALAQRWIFNLSRIFIDWNYGFSFKSPFPYLIIILILVLVGYSLYFVCRHTSKQVWLFILTLIAVTALALALPDLIFGGQRSRVSRYLLPCYLGIQLTVAYLVATHINSGFVSTLRQKFWQLIMVVLLSGGVLSCVISSQSKTWWNKSDGAFTLHIAAIVNKATSPLIISDTTPVTNVLSLSHLLSSPVKFQLVVEATIPQIPNSFSDVFLFNSSKTLRTKLEKELNYKLERPTNYGNAPLWKLSKPN